MGVVVAVTAGRDALLPRQFLTEIVKSFMAITTDHFVGTTVVTQVSKHLLVTACTLQCGHWFDGLGENIAVGTGSAPRCQQEKQG